MITGSYQRFVKVGQMELALIVALNVMLPIIAVVVILVGLLMYDNLARVAWVLAGVIFVGASVFVAVVYYATWLHYKYAAGMVAWHIVIVVFGAVYIYAALPDGDD